MLSFYKNSKLPSFTFAIPVYNEYKELENLLQFLLKKKNANDEILVLECSNKVTQKVKTVLKDFSKEVRIISYPFENHFAKFKNHFIKHAQKDFLFQIDADEMPSENMIENVRQALPKYLWADCFLVPRINIVKGITQKEIQQWNRKIDDKGRLEYPDYQRRIFRRKSFIRWKGKIHERLKRYRRKKKFPLENDDFCLYHIKSIERQKEQYNFYNSFYNENN